MIFVRVDDFPQTKGEPQHTLAAFRDFHRCLSECIGGRRYLLGVIPGRCTVEDLLFIRNETDVVVGMHGIDHDEKRLDMLGQEFAPWMSAQNITDELLKYRVGLETAVGRPVYIYMPPRNMIDERGFRALAPAGFERYTVGPETEPWARKMRGAIDSQPPYEYGRTDELLTRGAHEVITAAARNDNLAVLTLHWTWETNIGLQHMRKFFENIPRELFADF